MTNYKETISNKTSKFLLGAALSALLAGNLATSVKAESNNLLGINNEFSVSAELNVPQDSDYLIEYYNFKRNAESSHRMNQNMGKYSEMYYDSARRKWAVKSRKDRGSISSSDNSSSSKTSTTSNTTSNSEDYSPYYFTYKRAAQQFLQTQRSVGRVATMDSGTTGGRWVVRVRKNRGSINSRSATGTTTSVTNDLLADGGKLPNGSQIVYSTTKSVAEGLYRSAQKQGIWTRMWYDASRKSWAVAMK